MADGPDKGGRIGPRSIDTVSFRKQIANGTPFRFVDRSRMMMKSASQGDQLAFETRVDTRVSRLKMCIPLDCLLFAFLFPALKNFFPLDAGL